MKNRFILILLVAMQISLLANAKKQRQQLAVGNELCFRENKVQVTDQHQNKRTDVLYQLAVKDMSIFAGANGLLYQFYKPAGKDIKAYRLEMQLVGANEHPTIVAEKELEAHDIYYTNGLKGADAKSYEKLTYKEVYPGIDWVLYIHDGHLKYDFVLAAGADAGRIKIRYNGAAELSLVNNTLKAVTSLGTITEEKPFSYEYEGGKTVPSAYELKGNVLSFKIAKTNTKTVIDPVLNWATYYGGTAAELALNSTVDATGNVFLFGTSGSTANIATTGSFQSVISGSADFYLVKFSSAGARQWATYYGGTLAENDFSVACDASGNIVFCGASTSTSGVATTGSAQSVFGGGARDACVVKFNTLGTLVWATYIGGTGSDIANSVTCDANDNIYVAGQTTSTTAMATTGSYQFTAGGGTDAFLAMYNSAGVRQWGTYIAGTGTDVGWGVKASGNFVYMCGTTSSTAGMATSGSFQSTITGTTNAFLAKFSNTGAMQWSTYHGVSSDNGLAVNCDASGNVYLGGYGLSASTSLATTGAHQATFGGGTNDAWLAQFTSSGTRNWCTYYGGTGDEDCRSISCSPAGDVYIAGYTNSATAIATNNGQQTIIGGGKDAYVAVFNSAGVRQWGTYLGGTADEQKPTVTAAAGGVFYLSGYTSSTTGISTVSSFQPANAGSTDAFLARYIPGTICSMPFTPTATPQPNAVSAILNWTTNGPATQWDVEYGLNGFTPGTGTHVLVTVAPPYTLSGLLPNSTTYQYYVRSICGAGDTSTRIGTSFSTSCLPNSIPYNEGFESNVSATTLPACMSKVGAFTITNFSSSYGFGTYTAHSGNWYGRTEYAPGTMFTQPIQLTGGTTYRFSVWLNLRGNAGKFFYRESPICIKYGRQPNNDSMIYNVADTFKFTSGEAITGNPIGWRQVMANFTPAATGVYYVGIHSRPDANFSEAMLIDDISIINAPTCRNPDSLSIVAFTDTSATVDWRAQGAATQWQVQYGAAGFTPGTGTSGYATAHPFTVNGLTQATIYEYYVRSVCGANDTSLWYGPYRFKTSCTPATVPYDQGFENASPCDYIFDANQDGLFWTKSTLAHTGDSMLISPLQTAFTPLNNDWYFTRGVYLSASNQYQVSFWYRGAPQAAYPQNQTLTVYAGNTKVMYYNTTIAKPQAVVQLQQPLLYDTVAITADYNKYIESFTPPVSGMYYLAFHDSAKVFGGRLHLDDIRLTIADIAVSGAIDPAQDTMCINAAQPLSVTLRNNGLSAQTDSVFVKAIYSNGTMTDSLQAVYTDTLLAGAIDTVAMGMLDFSATGVYNVNIFIQHIKGDSSVVNDTLHKVYVVLDVPSVADILSTNTGNTYNFSPDNALYAVQYDWSFGDNSTHDNGATPTHTYVQDGTYTVTLIVSNMCGADTVTKTVQPTSGVAITPVDNDDIHIYPNPAKDYVKVVNGTRSSITGVTIYNSIGAVVWSSDKTAGKELTIDTRKFARGLYLVEVTAGQTTKTQKLELVK